MILIILVLNCGSSSLKFQLFDMQDEQVLAKGIVERIGLKGGCFRYHPAGKEPVILSEGTEFESHADALKAVLNSLTCPESGVIPSLASIKAVGHRVAHGGEMFSSAVKITSKVLDGIKSCIQLAPLHNPANITGIEECRRLMPNVTQVAVFDTAFHQTMPEEAFLYALPYEYYERHKIRRYGFHGTSHRFVAHEAAGILGKFLSDLKIISCHLGNGCSICAIEGGKSVDTSMGFTPLEGVPMGTRSGTVDPAIIEFLVKNEPMTIDMAMDILNKKSGIYGLSQTSSDFRDIEKGARSGDKRCIIALEVFTRAVKKYIGAYHAVLNGLDALIFTAGVGENSPAVREKVCQGLESLGVIIDAEANAANTAEIISAPGSKVKVIVIPTNEELLIAKDTFRLVSSAS